MLLYKFLHEKDESSHAVLKSCLDGNLMFSRIPELNDISEKFASVDNYEMQLSLDRIINEGCRDDEIANLQKHINFMGKIYPQIAGTFNRAGTLSPMLKIAPPEIIHTLVKELSRLLQKVNDDIQEKIGIFSATCTFDSFPLWAHYAENAKGFVIEYENLDKVFNGDNTGVFDEFKHITYCPNKRNCVSFSPSDLEELFFTKLADWAPEKEYRLVKLLNDCRTDGQKFFAKEKYSQYIKRVIVGWNNTQFDEIKEIVTQQNGCCIPVVQAIATVNHIQAR